jgi:hypothetical protein
MLSAWASKARDDLATAAKRYDWMTVFDLIRQHPHFVNSSRPDGAAWFAPLHQVAHGGASAEIANRLIAAGAWRSLRTSTGERPVDIARDRGHAHLVDALRPPRRVEVAPGVLSAIEQRFHEVVRGRMRDFRIEDGLRLPELEILLELPDPELWFPVPGMYGGFRFRLEVQDSAVRLISDSWCRVVGGSEERHEITESGVRAVSQRS